MEDKIGYEIPLTCPNCGQINKVDLENLENRPFSGVVTQEGYNCIKCGMWEPVFFTSISLENKIQAVRRLRGKAREKALLKAYKKAMNLQRKCRNEYGESKRKDMAES